MKRDNRMGKKGEKVSSASDRERCHQLGSGLITLYCEFVCACLCVCVYCGCRFTLGHRCSGDHYETGCMTLLCLFIVFLILILIFLNFYLSRPHGQPGAQCRA